MPAAGQFSKLLHLSTANYDNDISGSYIFVLIFSTIIFLLLSSCAPLPLSTVINDAITQPLHAHYIKGIPFVHQKTAYCGPAVIAEVMGFYGDHASVDSIAKAIWNKQQEGTLNIDILIYANKKGYAANQIVDGIDEIKSYIRSNKPVILLIDTGIFNISIYHYIVVKGFDDEHKTFVIDNGYKKNELISYSKLASQWNKAGEWGVVLYPK